MWNTDQPAVILAPDHVFLDEELQAIADRKHRPWPLPPFEVKQLSGFGAENFLVSKEQPFMVGAEFKSASGDVYDRAFIATAINVAPDLAKEVLLLRKKVRELKEEK